MANLSELLSLLQNEEPKYYVLRGRDLYTEDDVTILQNDNNSTKIEILLPTKLGGFELSEEYNCYIDYIDGAGKPGVVANPTTILSIYKQTKEQNTFVKMNDETPEIDSEGNFTITGEDKTFNIYQIENNSFSTDNANYIIETNVQYIGSDRTYNSKIKNENFEDSAEISLDYDNPYSKGLYFIKSGSNLENGTIKQDTKDGITYFYILWTLDKQVTNAAGTVTFSIRIENDETGFNWQSNTTEFKVVSNLKETYYLKKEIEENYVIQGREIKPVGDFKNILVKGDTNSNKLFYKMNRYYQGQDMLEHKFFNDNGTQKEVFKNQNRVFFIKENTNNETKYKALNVLYTINNISCWDANNNTYTYENGNIIGTPIQNISLELVVQSNTEPLKYKFILQCTAGEIPLDNLFDTQTITIDEQIYYLQINAYGSSFVISSDFKKDGDILVPVYNRLIRFNFLSPNKDFGDWNDGEIEYVNNEENYFIFSWTPNYLVTRNEGDLSYFIEFYINGAFEEAFKDSERTIVRNKAYSWSTLPSTIHIESNEAATARVDYIPHWVAYIENELQGDMDAFLNNDLQSQYNTLAAFFAYSLLGDSVGTALSLDNDSRVITLDNVTYNVTLTDNNSKLILNTSGEPVYGGEGNLLTLSNNSSLKGGSITITKPTTSEEEENKAEYYVIFNTNKNQLTFYSTKIDGIQVPFLKVANDRIQTIKSDGQSKINEIQNNYDDIVVPAIERQLGISLTEEEANLYNRVWAYFNTLGSSLEALYNGENRSLYTVTLDGSAYTVTNIAGIPQFDTDNKTYYIQNIRGLDSEGQEASFIEIEDDVSDFYTPGLYYILNEEEYVISQKYKEGEIYYLEPQGTAITFNISKLSTSESPTANITLNNKTYTVGLNTLYNKIEADINEAENNLKEEINESVSASLSDAEKDLKNYTKEQMDTLNTNINSTYSQINASINAQYNSIIAAQSRQIQNAINTRPNYSFQFQTGDLIISASNNTNS